MSPRDIVGMILIVAVLSVLISGMIWVDRERESVRKEAAAFCDVDFLDSHTVVLVDQTDPLTPEHQELLNTIIVRTQANLEVGGRLSIFAMGGEEALERPPVFTGCRPEQSSDVSWLTRNPTMVQARYEALFQTPLRKQIAELRKPAQANLSPILETIKHISLLPDFGSSVERRRLVVISDLLQNTEGLSFYRSTPNYRTFADSWYAKSLQTDLSGIHVELVVLERGSIPHSHRKSLLFFWQSWLRTESGGILGELVTSVR